MNLLCRRHQREVVFRTKGGPNNEEVLVINHRSDGTRCELPVMSGGRVLIWNGFHRVLARDE